MTDKDNMTYQIANLNNAEVHVMDMRDVAIQELQEEVARHKADLHEINVTLNAMDAHLRNNIEAFEKTVLVINNLRPEGCTDLLDILKKRTTRSLEINKNLREVIQRK